MDSSRLGTAVLAAVLPAALWVGSPAEAQPAITKTTAKALLAKLPVAAERDSYTGFPGGLEAWAKSTVKKCRTVHDQVIAEEALDPAPRACVTFNRVWKDPWLGNRTQSASAMTTVRLVFPGEAWNSGAWAWDSGTQSAFANDVNFARTLVAVTSKADDACQDREPGAWLPSKKALRLRDRLDRGEVPLAALSGHRREAGAGRSPRLAQSSEDRDAEAGTGLDSGLTPIFGSFGQSNRAERPVLAR